MKTGAKKRFYNASDPFTWVGDMKIHKGYLYFTTYGTTFNKDLYRIKLNGSNRKRLATMEKYAISSGKIYYDFYNPEYDDYDYKYMKLNGKSKKYCMYKINMKHKKSNKSGFRIVTKSGRDYLRLPGGRKIMIAKVTTY